MSKWFTWSGFAAGAVGALLVELTKMAYAEGKKQYDARQRR